MHYQRSDLVVSVYIKEQYDLRKTLMDSVVHEIDTSTKLCVKGYETRLKVD